MEMHRYYTIDTSVKVKEGPPHFFGMCGVLWGRFFT